MRMTFAAVRAIGCRLPDVEESTMYGSPALKVSGRIIACMASHKSAEPNTLVVMVPFDQRSALIEDQPDTYYLKAHYENYPAVLVRLSRIRRDALEDLLTGAWRFVREKAARRAAGPRRRRRSPR